jgi:hypothetical protein
MINDPTRNRFVNCDLVVGRIIVRCVQMSKDKFTTHVWTFVLKVHLFVQLTFISFRRKSHLLRLVYLSSLSVTLVYSSASPITCILFSSTQMNTLYVSLMILSVFLALTATAKISEHWFMFDRYVFPGFYTPLVSLNDSTIQNTSRLTFAFLPYDDLILLTLTSSNVTEIKKEWRLNIDRADLLSHKAKQMIFVGIRRDGTIETYVNCKLIESIANDPQSFDLLSHTWSIDQLTDLIDYHEITTDYENERGTLFDNLSCKSTRSVAPSKNDTPTIKDSTMIRKMQYIIDRVRQTR